MSKDKEPKKRSKNKKNRELPTQSGDAIIPEDDEDFGFSAYTVYADYFGQLNDLAEDKRSWQEIDDAVMEYQKQFKYSIKESTGKRVCDGFNENASKEIKENANKAALKLVMSFKPMIKKYISLFKTGQINFNDQEQKIFVSLFLESSFIKKCLWNKNISKDIKDQITAKFNFICEGYGKQDKENIEADLSEMVLYLAQRYNNVGKNFCTFLYHSFNYTVARKIVKPYQKEILNFHYKKMPYEEFALSNATYDTVYEDEVYEDENGVPDLSWVKGDTCSDIFSMFTPEERNILSKYYLAGWNDSQIAESIGMHINTVNTKRRKCLEKLAAKKGIDVSTIKRNRRSGKKAIGIN
jgi:hypothetical protein